LSHAWVCRESDGRWRIGGFSTSEEHARQSLAAYCLGAETGVVPTVPVDDAIRAKL
jgi:hypothetical protein